MGCKKCNDLEEQKNQHEKLEEHVLEHKSHIDEEEEEVSLKKVILAAVLFLLAVLLEKLPVFAFDGAVVSGSSTVYAAVRIAYLALYAASYVLVGLPVIHEVIESISHKEVFNEEFLMLIATLGAVFMKEYSEAVAVMILFQLGEYLEDKAVNHSKKSIRELLKIRPDNAFVKKEDATVTEVSAREVKIGEVIVVKPGERIPLDGIILTGSTYLDSSALTGESVPVLVNEGDVVLSGCVNTSGVIEIKVQKEFGESTVSRILDLVENAQEKKTKSEKFITRFARVYTPIVCILAVAVAVVPAIVTWGHYDYQKWIYRALELLVVSCPCALVISVPLSFMSGIGRASRNGILVKGSGYMELLSRAQTVVFDKTGTLTEGVFEVADVIPASADYSKEEILTFATHAEYYSNHPISLSLKKAHSCEKCGTFSSKEMQEISGHGIKCALEGKNILVGNEKLMEKEGVKDFKKLTDSFGTIVYVSVDGTFAGTLVISDKVKKDSVEAISSLHKIGVKRTVMLTGDSESAAKKVYETLSLDEYYAGLLPQDKVSYVEKFISQRSKKQSVIFTGDGINDAPVLVRADVGIAMGGLGSDAAIEASDIVIMDDKISKVPLAVKIAKKTILNANENIVFALGVKLAIIVLCILGIADMWIAVFGDVGVTMIAVLNSMRLLAGSKKRVKSH